jgi:hypothetical protein
MLDCLDDDTEREAQQQPAPEQPGRTTLGAPTQGGRLPGHNSPLFTLTTAFEGPWTSLGGPTEEVKRPSQRGYQYRSFLGAAAGDRTSVP